MRSIDAKLIDIRWSDLDAYGHVNQAVYLTYAEEIVDDWFRRRLGLAEGEIWHYVVARTAIDYRSELGQTDVQVGGTVEVVRVGTKSITARVELRSRSGRVAATVETVLVAIDGHHGPPRAVSAAERAALERA